MGTRTTGEQTALEIVVFVGAFSLSLIIVAAAITITSRMLKIDVNDVVEWLIPAIIGTLSGAFSVRELKRRRNGNNA